jgi:PAS domain S-box-containing protein
VKSFLDDLRTAGVTDIESYFERRPEAVRRCAELTKIVDVNRASLALHGAANKDELLARLAETFTPESHETFRQKLVCLWKGRTEMAAEGVVKTLAGEFRRVTVSFSVCPGYEKSLGKVYASLIDVTERKRAETQAQERREELLHVSRLNTLGEMASGLAHELSQPLSAIVNHTEACIRRIASSQVDGAGIVRGLEKVADQAKRAGNILGRIRALAQRRPPRFAAVNVNEVVEDVIDLISWEVRHWEVTVKLKLGPALPAVYADRIQIEQVVLNLVRNAIEAMIAVEQRRRLLTVRTRAGGDGSVQVEVCDTGVGFPEDDADRIFQPFFTTKANGLGIGLSISRTIAEMHNGTLEAKRNVDCGSTLVLVLPIA